MFSTSYPSYSDNIDVCNTQDKKQTPIKIIQRLTDADSITDDRLEHYPAVQTLLNLKHVVSFIVD
jgi:hypothetical protein